METLGYIGSTYMRSLFQKIVLNTGHKTQAILHIGTNMSVTEVFHPLIKEPVVNPITTSKHVLVTGSKCIR